MGFGAALGAAASIAGGIMGGKSAEKGAEQAAEAQKQTALELARLQQEWMTPEFKSFSDPFAYFQPNVAAGPVTTSGTPMPGVDPMSGEYRSPELMAAMAAGAGAGGQYQPQEFQAQAFDPVFQYGARQSMSDMRTAAQWERSLKGLPQEVQNQIAQARARQGLKGRGQVITGMANMPMAGIHYETDAMRQAREAGNQRQQSLLDIAARGGAGGRPIAANTVGLSPAQDLLRRQSFALQQQAFGQLSGGLEGMMGQELDLMRRLSAEQEAKAREALFGQQVRTGVLESTTGVDRMREFESQMAQEDLRRQLAAIQGARQERAYQGGVFAGGFDLAAMQQQMAYRPMDAAIRLATATRGGGNIPGAAGVVQAAGMPAQARAAASGGMWQGLSNLAPQLGQALGGMFGGGGGGAPGGYSPAPPTQQLPFGGFLSKF